MIIHYNCTIGSFLLHYFLLIYHPYPPSFHEMIFTLVPLIFSLRRAQSAKAHQKCGIDYVRMRISTDHAPAE